MSTKQGQDVFVIYEFIIPTTNHKQKNKHLPCFRGEVTYTWKKFVLSTADDR